MIMFVMCQKIAAVVFIVTLLVTTVLKLFFKDSNKKMLLMIIKKLTLCIFLFSMTLTMYKDAFCVFFLMLYVIYSFNTINWYEVYKYSKVFNEE